MNGFIRKAIAGFCFVGGFASIGCMGGERYRNLVDPCYSQRYSSTARQQVIASFAPQVQNGHILDQTIWNYHFENGSDKLNPSGLDKLDQIVRRRPEPDTRVFLATARDVGYSPDDPEKYGETQQELNGKRVAAIEQYLKVQTTGRPLKFDVLVHDPSDPAISAVSARIAVLGQRSAYVGSTQGAGGGGTLSTGGTGAGVGATGGTTGGGAGATGNTGGGGAGGGGNR